MFCFICIFIMYKTSMLIKYFEIEKSEKQGERKGEVEEEEVSIN